MTHDVFYFDYAAATPLDARVLEAMLPYMTDKFYNPSSPYAPAVEVRREYNDAKQRLAHTFGASGDELVMTAGATESINLALGSFSGHKVTAATEHASVLAAIKRGAHTILPVDAHGRVTPDAVTAAIHDDTEVVSIALANHEIGSIQPLRDIAARIDVIRTERKLAGNTTPLVLHSDASQGFGLLDIHVGRLGVDVLTLNAAKIYGPKQVGLLWVKPGVILQPTIVGGGQELGLRSGTENVAGTIGFACAAELASKKRAGEVRRIVELRDVLVRQLAAALPTAVFSGHPKHRLANFCHLSLPGIDAERLVFLLEMQQLYVATGSACAANSGTRSSVLEAIGLDDVTADGSLRLTLGRDTTREHIEYATQKITEAVRSEAARTGVRV